MSNIVGAINTIHPMTTLISMVSLFLLYLPKWFPKVIPKWVPMPLFVIIAMVIISWQLEFDKTGISIVGNKIETGFPIPGTGKVPLPDPTYFIELIPGGLVLAIVSYMGSIALAKGFDQKTRQEYKEKLEKYNEYFNEEFITSPMDNSEINAKPKTKTNNVHQTAKTPLLDAEDVNTQNSIEMSITSTSAHNAPFLSGTAQERKQEQEKDTFVMMSDKKQTVEDEEEPERPTRLPSILLNPDIEFLAFGIGNVVGSFFGSMVTSGSFSRSGLNYDMNGHTQISGLLQAIICLTCLLFLMPLLAPLPNGVLAAVVTISVHRLIKNGILEFSFLWSVSRIELIEFLAAFIAPLIVGLEIGIFIAIGVSILVSLLQHTFVGIIQLGQLKTINDRDNTEYVNVEIFHEANFVENITILELKAELSFANSRKLARKIRELLEDQRKFIIVSLMMTRIMDTTTITQIEGLFSNLKSKNAYLGFSYCRPEVVEVIKRYEFKKEKRFPENVRMFVSTHDAVSYFERLINDAKDGNDMEYETIKDCNGHRSYNDNSLVTAIDLNALQDTIASENEDE